MDSVFNLNGASASGVRSIGMNQQAGSYQGSDFELRIQMHLMVRGLARSSVENNYSFEIGTQFPAARKFDDVVFKYREGSEEEKKREKICFIQAKHGHHGGVDQSRAPPEKLRKQALFTKNGDFSLLTYADSYQSICDDPEFENVELEQFILVTNRDLHDDAKKDFTVINSLLNSILQLDGAEYYDVPEKNVTSVASQLKSILRSANKLTKQKSNSLETLSSLDDTSLETTLCKFLRHLTLAVKLPDEEALGKLIRREARDHLKWFDRGECQVVDMDFVFSEFQERMLAVRKEEKFRFLTHLDAKKIFKDIASKHRVLSLRESGKMMQILGSDLQFNDSVIGATKRFLCGEVFRSEFSGPAKAQVLLMDCTGHPGEGVTVFEEAELKLVQSNFLKDDAIPYDPSPFSLSCFKGQPFNSIEELVLIGMLGHDQYNRQQITALFRQVNNHHLSKKCRLKILILWTTEKPTSLVNLFLRKFGQKHALNSSLKCKSDLVIDQFLTLDIVDGRQNFKIFTLPAQQNVQLSTIMVNQALHCLAQVNPRYKRNKRGYFFETLTALLDPQRWSNVKKALRAPGTLDLLIVTCIEGSLEKFSGGEKLRTLLGELFLIMAQLDGKRIIFILPKGKEELLLCKNSLKVLEQGLLMQDSDSNKNAKLVKIYAGLNSAQKEWLHELFQDPQAHCCHCIQANNEGVVEGIDDLIPESADKLFQRPVIFQGQSSSFGDILGTPRASMNNFFGTQFLIDLLEDPRLPIILGSHGPDQGSLEFANFKTHTIVPIQGLENFWQTNESDKFVIWCTDKEKMAVILFKGSKERERVEYKEDSNPENLNHQVILENLEEKAKDQFRRLCHQLDEDYSRTIKGNFGNSFPAVHLLQQEQRDGLLLWKQTYCPHFYMPRRFYGTIINLDGVQKFSQLSNPDPDPSILIFSGADDGMKFLKLLFSPKEDLPKSDFVPESPVCFPDHAAARRHFDSLCENENIFFIHWFKMIEDSSRSKNIQIEWYQSRCPPGALILMAATRTQGDKFMDEVNLAKTTQRVVILADEPGMGKSTTLARIGEYTKRVDPLAWIIKIDLNQYQMVLASTDLQTNGRGWSVDDILDVICFVDPTVKSAITRQILKSRLVVPSTSSSSPPGQVIMLLDGFDEIKSERQSSALTFMKACKEKTMVNIWVTTRRHDQQKLENCLSAVAHVFEPLREQQQINFLSQFWQATLKLVLVNIEPKTFDMVAQKVLERFETSIKSDKRSKTEKPFISIPLRARMLAEVFRDKVKHTLVTALEGANGGDDLWMELFPTNQKKMVIGDLFHQFIEKKYEIYLHNKVGVADGLDVDSKKSLHNSYTRAYEELAFKKLFEEDVSNTFSGCWRETFSTNVLQRIGLIQGVHEDSASFIHRTFAEYFVATRLVSWIRDPQMCTEMRCDFFFEKILLQPWPVIRAFSNDIIGQAPIRLDRVSKNCFHKLWFKPGVQDKLRVVLTEGNEALHKLLVQTIPGQLRIRQYLNPEAIRSFTEETDSSWYRGTTVLDDATKEGNPKVVNVLLEFGTKFDDTVDASNAIRLAYDASVVQCLDWNGENVLKFSPLHFAVSARRYDIALVLLKNGASYNSIDNNGRTPLQLAKEIFDQSSGIGASFRGLFGLISKLFELVRSVETSKLDKKLSKISQRDDRIAVLNASSLKGYCLLQLSAHLGLGDATMVILGHGAVFDVDQPEFMPIHTVYIHSRYTANDHEVINSVLDLLQKLFDMVKNNDFKQLFSRIRCIQGTSTWKAVLNARNARDQKSLPELVSDVAAGDSGDADDIDENARQVYWLLQAKINEIVHQKNRKHKTRRFFFRH